MEMNPITEISRSIETEVTISFSEVAVALSRTLKSQISAINAFVDRMSKAIRNAVDTLEATVEAITRKMSFGIKRLTEGLMGFLMELWCSFKHSITATKSAFFEKYVGIYYLKAISIIVRTLTLGFLEHCCIYRMIQLLRHQGRGSTDSASENDNSCKEIKRKANW